MNKEKLGQHWHTLIFSYETRIDMRFVCPRDAEKILVQRARSVYWKKWAAKHEQEELNEGVLLEPALALLQKKAKGFGPKSIVLWPERFCWKEGGRTRDFSILAGRTQVTRGKAQKSTGFTTVQNGTKSGGIFRSPSKSRRKSGSGREVSSRTLSMKANGTEAISA